MKRFARTLSSKRASQPTLGRAQWSVGSIEDDGILYGLTTYALTRRTIAMAAMIVTAQSTTTRTGSGRRRVSRSTGFREWWRGRSRSAGGSLVSGRGGSSAGVVGQPPLSPSGAAGSSASTGPGSGGGLGVDASGSGEEPRS